MRFIKQVKSYIFTRGGVKMVYRIKVYLYGHLSYTIIKDTEADAWEITTELRAKHGNDVDFIVEEVYLYGK